MLNQQQIIESVRQWVETVVIGLNLCPFAREELINNRIRFAVSDAITEEQLLATLHTELALLDSNKAIETTLLIHPNVLADFDDYNQFLSYADNLLAQMSFAGIYQIASFHPDYQFAGTNPGDAENYTNRSPYPILHLLREASLERAIAGYADADKIPERNIALMETMGAEKLKALLQGCFDDADK
ncbi:MAG: DUF1415 domain-containing protein [Gammaproteobacteria bacterium]|nr:MAG: DUF1415 domain-containing protein [Gammaproteobacteria bacterium]RLA46280.1 MAG: DUF1415 domain-containing protein [Gammaproteobacteria bacterium]